MNARIVLGVIGIGGATVLLGQLGSVDASGPAQLETLEPAVRFVGDEGTLNTDHAQPIGAIGPDVIVGFIPNYSNFTEGDEPTKRAYSFGTTSCNAGDETLRWQSSTKFHPVIGQSMYRYDGRSFEHIGQSFLKHGFCALSGNECGFGCQSTGCSTLGVGCSDPYGSGLNANRFYLGPKYEVNAATGDFPYPFANISYSGNLAKRLIVNRSDVEAASNPGAKYFVEAQYITSDDNAAGGNSWNNASYRGVNLASDGTVVGFIGGTQREKPALYAWVEEDPSVDFQRVEVTNDGNYYIAHRVYDNGDGTWDYHYAVMNFDSHRSARSLNIPIPAGVNVSNFDFHDVDYHSGEIWDGTDWAVAIGGTTLTWETGAYNTSLPDFDNVDNAIRWGTTYSFSFRADTAPQKANATVGLYRPGDAGDPDSFSFSTLAPSPGPCPQDLAGNDGVVDSNDLFALLGAWGKCAGCDADLDGNNVVDSNDLFELLGAWGDC